MSAPVKAARKSRAKIIGGLSGWVRSQNTISSMVPQMFCVNEYCFKSYPSILWVIIFIPTGICPNSRLDIVGFISNKTIQPSFPLGICYNQIENNFLIWSQSTNKLLQWRIQDFPEGAVADRGFPRGGAPTSEGGANLLFGQFFPKTAWKWRNFGPEGWGARPSRPTFIRHRGARASKGAPT